MGTNAHRRVISPFFSLILVLALFGAGIGIAAAANPIVSITPTTQNVGVGEDFEVSIEVNPNGNDLQMAKVGLTYDSTLVTMTPATNGGMFTTSFGAGSDDGAGTVTNIFATGSSTSTTGYLAVLHMTADSAGTFDLVLSSATAGTAGGQLTPSVNSGTVIVTDNDPPNVTVTYPVSGTVSGTIDVTADADDGPDGSVAQVAFYLMPAETLIGTDANSTGGWSVQLDTTTAADGTDYQIKAVATDNEDATGENTGSAFTIDNSCPCDFCLELEAGLNFVSIPKTLNGSNVAETVFSIDSYNGEFCLYYNAATGSYDTDPRVKQCLGYWVYKNEATTICINFNVAAGASSQQLYEGWNMIGHIDTEEMPIYEAGNDADFGSMTGLEEPEDIKLFRQVNAYTQDAGWTNYPASDLTQMTPGTGYWILVKEDVIMYGIP